jgi:hypothetical protein
MANSHKDDEEYCESAVYVEKGWTFKVEKKVVFAEGPCVQCNATIRGSVPLLDAPIEAFAPTQAYSEVKNKEVVVPVLCNCGKKHKDAYDGQIHRGCGTTCFVKVKVPLSSEDYK